MYNNIISTVLGAVALGLTGVIIAIIKSVGDVAIEYIAKKKQAVEQTLKLEKHEEEFKTAKDIWNIVEEKYRVTENIEDLASKKANEFDKLLLEKIPYLTKQELYNIRQAIAGEINKGKALLYEDNLKKQAEELVTKNLQLQQENNELKNRFNTISSVVPKEQEQ